MERRTCVGCGKLSSWKWVSGFSQSKETYRCYGCAQKKRYQNPKERENASKIAIKRCQNPEYKLKNKESMQKLAHDPEWQRKQKEYIKQRMQDPSYYKKLEEGIKKRSENIGWHKNIIKRSQDPDYRKWNLDHLHNLNSDPNYRREHKKAMQKLAQDPEWQRKNKEAAQNPGKRQKQREASLKLAKDINYLKRVSEGVQKALWGRTEYIINRIKSYYGGEFLNSHSDIDPIKYCEIFNEVDPRVRIFQRNICLLCEKTEIENGNKLHNHHVFYEKKTCCWLDANGEYWTTLNVKNHTDPDYYIGKNPNYFALLCNRCHGSTNGNYENRKASADKLRAIIDNRFGGKSYYTEDEMLELGYIKISKYKWDKKIIGTPK
jgi:hypothetical protein